MAALVPAVGLKEERRWMRALSAHVASGLVISVPYQRGMLAPSGVRRGEGLDGLSLRSHT
jgi:hypothetical protein